MINLDRIYEIKINGEQLDILYMLIKNEIEYYKNTEEDTDVKEYIETLNTIIKALEDRKQEDI